MKESYVAKAISQKGGVGRAPSRGIVIWGWTFSLLGGLFGILIARHIAYGKDKADPSRRTYAYDEASRSRGKVMLGVAVVMIFVWIAIRLASVVPHPPR
jgi:hypothetical protein